jgi:hypothetical protein
MIFPKSATISDETTRAARIARVGYRSFDRQFIIYDSRVIDRPRPQLWQVASDVQVFVTEQHAHTLEMGPGLVFTADVPDMHYINGRGGRVLPLYRDRAGLATNFAPGLTRLLSERLGRTVTAADLLAYIAAVTAHAGYTATFREELRTPGVRVPLTADAELWEQAVGLGRRVLWLHTYGERFTDPADNRPAGPPRAAAADRPKVQVAIPGTIDDMPDDISYDAQTATLHVGAGQIAPVRPKVWAYEVSGMRIIKKWFGYRKKNRARAPRCAWWPARRVRGPASSPPCWTSCRPW